MRHAGTQFEPACVAAVRRVVGAHDDVGLAA
jgi:hypothetical protein